MYWEKVVCFCCRCFSQIAWCLMPYVPMKPLRDENKLNAHKLFNYTKRKFQKHRKKIFSQNVLRLCYKYKCNCSLNRSLVSTNFFLIWFDFRSQRLPNPLLLFVEKRKNRFGIIIIFACKCATFHITKANNTM